MNLIRLALFCMVTLLSPTVASTQSAGSYVCNHYNNDETGWCGYVSTVYDQSYRIELTKVECSSGNFLLPCTNLRPETCSGNQRLYTLDNYCNPDYITVPKWCVNGSDLRRRAPPKDYAIKIRNSCEYSFRGFARYKNLSGNWVNSDWFSFPNTKARYDISGVKTKNRTFYLYLEYSEGPYAGQAAKLNGDKNTRSKDGKSYVLSNFSSSSLPTGVSFCS